MNYLTREQQALLILLRQSLWGETGQLPSGIDWETVLTSAKEQGVGFFVYDGIVATKAEVTTELLQQWRTSLLRNVLRNERLLAAQDELIVCFSKADIRSAILKGSSVARYYPSPELRVLGDIDILVRREDVNSAKVILESLGYQMCESDHDFHIGYKKQGAYVEVHYAVTKMPDSAGGRVTQEVTDHFLEDIDQRTLNNHVFPVLSEPHQAIMLLLHMIRHMFGEGIGLRQLCDWAVYIHYTDPVGFAEQTIPLLAKCGLLQYAKVATGACKYYLGLPEKNASWCADVEYEACSAFIADVFRTGNMGAANEAMGSLFTDSDAMGTGQSGLEALVSGANRLAYMHFPATKKYKVLLPFVWLYLPLRYFVRSLLGLRPKKSARTVLVSAQKRRQLYEMLNLFELD